MKTTNSQSVSRSALLAIAMILLLGSTSGCTTVLSPITGIPVSQLPRELLGIRRSEFVPVPVVMLTRSTEPKYYLDEGDILGVYIDGVMPYSDPTTVPTPPPVNFPDGESDRPPTIGYPIPVQSDGIINLPLLEPFSVKGMTVAEARSRIAQEYRDRQILREADTVPVVSLMRERENTINVIRYNATSESGTDGTAAGFVLKLPESSSDVLNALNKSGGLPGFNEKNEVVIFKTSRIPEGRRREIVAQIMSAPGKCQHYLATQGCAPQSCGPAMMTGEFVQGEVGQNEIVYNGMTFPHDGSFIMEDGLLEEQAVVRIPLRVPPGQIPNIQPSDVELENGDIVMVESRDTEFYYTGGLLRGGQFPLPRDYDLDVLGAIALAGQGVGSQQGGAGGGGGIGGGLAGGLGGPSPTQLYIIRKLPCGRTYNISVDLQQAMNDSRENILVQPGDTLVLRYKPHEELANFGIGTFFTFGIRELFRGD